MTIPFEARISDLFNLAISKGSNFVLTIILFSVIANEMTAREFSEFGYWWSLSIMAGGILFGGLASSLIRESAFMGSIRHLRKPTYQIALLVVTLLSIALITMIIAPQIIKLGKILFAAIVFGIAVQTQTIVLSLLRSVEATRENILASSFIIILVPAFIFFCLGANRHLETVFLALALGFGFGTAISLIIARKKLAPIWQVSNNTLPDSRHFYKNVLSFTVVNIFSFSIINIDFILFKALGSADTFTVMATVKIFFERFILPLILVFLGAISLRILRYDQPTIASELRITVTLNLRLFLGAILVIGFSTLFYWIFLKFFRKDSTSLDIHLVVCVVIGYLLYAFNGVLLDLIVLRQPFTNIVAIVFGFLILACILHTWSIKYFGLQGWALSWLAFNILFTFYLSKRSLRLV